VVFVARQSKFGSTKISILSLVSVNKQFLMDLMFWFEIFCFSKMPQLESRFLIHSAFSSIARRRFRNPVQPFLDRAVQLRGRAVKFGVATK